MSIIDDSLGKKFGKLVVERFVEFRQTPSKANVPMVECECECGKSKIVSLWDVRCGKTKTCGFNHPHYEDRTLPAFNNIYEHSYKRRAIKDGLEFAISKEKFKELVQDKCHYCGSEPYGEEKIYENNRGVRKSGKYISRFIYNGLDRIDSNKGYVIDNVVSCCGICNHAKHTMSYEKFVAWLDRLVNFRSKDLSAPAR